MMSTINGHARQVNTTKKDKLRYAKISALKDSRFKILEDHISTIRRYLCQKPVT